MPGILTHDCPYCGTRSVAFTCRGMHYEQPSLDGYGEIGALLSCGNCNKSVLTRMMLVTAESRDKLHILLRQDANFGFETSGFSLVDFHPSLSAVGAPDHTPPRVADLFRQATSNFFNKNWDASGAMSRKALDVATKIVARERLPAEVADEVARSWLKKRVQLLEQHGELTPDVANLAQHIKNGGDDASHDEDPYTEYEAAQLLKLSEVLLTYVFTIRGMVAEAEAQAEGSGT